MRLVGRRLPDLLIGILIVVLALGLGSLLLTQRNRAAITPSALTPPPASTADIPAAPGTGVTNTQAVTPPDAGQGSVGQTGTTSAVPSTPAATVPAASPATDPSQAAQTPVTDPAASTPASGDQTATVAQPESPTTPPSTAAPAQPGQTQPSTGPVATSPLAPPVTPQPDTSQPPVTTTPAPMAQPTAQPATGQPTTPASPTAPPTAATTPPRSGGAVATSENRTPLRRDYRISLGTFGSVAEAQASTAAVSALGYTVYPIDLGSQVVAQVGPFASASDANAALSDILRAYGGALLYAPRSSVSSGLEQPAASGSSDSARNNAAGVAAPSPSAASAVSSAVTSSPAPAQAAPSQPAQAAAPSGPVYLQVGAFDRQESAARLVGLLDDLGYNPSVQAPEGKKVTVLIGPFSGEAVLRAESKLNDNGFDHFRVR
ncbi:SPOR domain-containing protein [Deinococcus psychrotolerans]|uniref:SPOR domain-containing protein n=1 Tax=Deinococcus psychrotolerans TaxID=2489213 RepID=A0A3G8YGN4_9DEIO|nr:SPOR domain-containing protein [Deinococcus psychrotolerans]AZI43347.1 SPOR domain-containing protein [Deinococcus psychrotolerans]